MKIKIKLFPSKEDLKKIDKALEWAKNNKPKKLI
jgi:hypothetical protein